MACYMVHYSVADVTLSSAGGSAGKTSCTRKERRLHVLHVVGGVGVELHGHGLDCVSVELHGLDVVRVDRHGQVLDVVRPQQIANTAASSSSSTTTTTS